MTSGAGFIIRGGAGTGKTTVIKRLAAELSRFSPAGFYTEEVMAEARRVGFRITGLDGSELFIKKPSVTQPQRAWRYETDTAGLDSYLTALEKSSPGLILIDELGRLETTSPKLLLLAGKWLASGRIVIATVADSAPAPVERLLDRDDLELYSLGRQNSERLIDSISKEVHGLFGQVHS